MEHKHKFNFQTKPNMGINFQIKTVVITLLLELFLVCFNRIIIEFHTQIRGF